jgi:hypothetical protein
VPGGEETRLGHDGSEQSTRNQSRQAFSLYIVWELINNQCRLLPNWGEEHSFLLDSARASWFKERISEITRLRIADDCPADEINAAAAAMSARLDQAVAASALLPTHAPSPPQLPALPPSPPPTTPPPLPTQATAPSIPPWWPELLLRTRDLCEECEEIEVLKQKLEGRPDAMTHWVRNMSSPSSHWDDNHFQPVVDLSLIDWLLAEIDRTPPEFPSLIRCLAEPDLLDAHPLPEKRSTSMFMFASYFGL